MRRAPAGTLLGRAWMSPTPSAPARLGSFGRRGAGRPPGGARRGSARRPGARARHPRRPRVPGAPRRGSGRDGRVYLAHDQRLDRPVALKVALFGASPRERARLLERRGPLPRSATRTSGASTRRGRTRTVASSSPWSGSREARSATGWTVSWREARRPARGAGPAPERIRAVLADAREV